MSVQWKVHTPPPPPSLTTSNSQMCDAPLWWGITNENLCIFWGLGGRKLEVADTPIHARFLFVDSPETSFWGTGKDWIKSQKKTILKDGQFWQSARSNIPPLEVYDNHDFYDDLLN